MVLSMLNYCSRKSSDPLSVCANEGSSLARKYSKSGVSA